jgi:hypothetical protein
MPYPIGFFEIQDQFARRLSKINGMPYEEVLVNYTAVYRRIGGVDRKQKGKDPQWKRLMKRIADGEQPAQVMFDLYKKTRHLNPDHIERFGCMGFDRREDRIIMHFLNDGCSKHGPLSRHHIADRMSELKCMFAEIAANHADAQVVEGFTWLYNYKAYRRLFPPEFTATMQEVPILWAICYNSCWGQFIESSDQMNVERVRTFTENLAAAKTRDEVLKAFPLKVFKPQAPLSIFYPFYGLPIPKPKATV